MTDGFSLHSIRLIALSLGVLGCSPRGQSSVAPSAPAPLEAPTFSPPLATVEKTPPAPSEAPPLVRPASPNVERLVDWQPKLPADPEPLPPPPSMHEVPIERLSKPHAAYLHALHGRIHPFFADVWLGKFEALPASDPKNDQRLVTRIALAVRGADGSIANLRIVKPSGLDAFDKAVIDSVNRAAPFSAAPPSILSDDGNFYVRWDFRRDEVLACSPLGARPYHFVR